MAANVDDPRPVVEPPSPLTPAEVQPSLGALFRRLAEDSRSLIRQEISLAKAEIRQSVGSLARDIVLIGVGGGLLVVGLLVLTVAVVIGLGALLGGAYGWSSFLVGVALLLIGGLTLRSGAHGVKQTDLIPEQTSETLRENKEWAEGRIRKLKSDLGT